MDAVPAPYAKPAGAPCGRACFPAILTDTPEFFFAEYLNQIRVGGVV